jgi:cytosine/adenosine deaminase-related metal-dependent hydrolase
MRRKLTRVIVIFIFCLTANSGFGQSKTVKVDVLIRNCTVVDVINKKVLLNKNITIRNGCINSISDNSDLIRASKIIDGSHFIALPGFIDTHTHLWQHICKSCYPKESLQTWIRVYRAIHYLTKEDLYKVVLAASSEALLSGITTVADYASLSFNDYGFETNANAIRNAGLGGILVWHNPSVFLPDSLKLLEIIRLQNKYKKDFSIWMGPGPLSFHSLPQVYSGVLIAQKLNLSVTEHTMENNQEQKDFYDSLANYVKEYKDQFSGPDREFLENILQARRPANVDGYEQWLREASKILTYDSFLRNTPKYIGLNVDQIQLLKSLNATRTISPMVILDYFNILDSFLAIHSVWQEGEDIQLMKRKRVSVSHNPESNMYLSSGLAPVQDYLGNCIIVSIGTDGGASNDGINYFSAMREMWNVSKIRAMNTWISKDMDEWTILQAATINGAKALKISDKTGSIDVGKQADLSLVSTSELGMSPLRIDKMISLLIYSGNTRNVKYVFSKGKIVVANSKLTKYKEEKLAKDLTTIAIKVDDQIAKGKIWSEKDTIKNFNSIPYWYKYESVRSADSIDIEMINGTKQPVAVTIISSAATFGGGSPYVIDEKAGERFPKKPPVKAFKQLFSIPPKQLVRVQKSPKKNEYILTSGGNKMIIDSDIGQLLLLCQK